MSRLSRYNFDKAKYDAVNSDECFPPDEPLDRLIARHENEINEIVQKCTTNEVEWKNNKLVYRAFELTAFTFSFVLSLVSFTLTTVFFPKYFTVFQYIKDMRFTEYQLFSYLPIIHLVLEGTGVFFDAIKASTSFRIFRIFAAESRLNKSMNHRSRNTDDYMLIYSENTIIMKTIRSLRQRVDIKTELKKMFKSLIRLEILGLYFVFFVFVPKILAAGYIQINLINHFKENTTENREIDRRYFDEFNCCIPGNSTSFFECDDRATKIECVNGSVVIYLNILTIFFIVTALLKLIAQILLGVNLKVNLMDNLVKKRYVEEINLKRKYDHNRSASFSANVQLRIEENSLDLAEQLRMLYNNSSDLEPIYEGMGSAHPYAEIHL